MALKYAGYKNDLVDFYAKYIGLEHNGKKLNISCKDKYGKLTCVNGLIKTEGNKISGSLDIRVPVTINSKKIRDKLLKNNYSNTKFEIKSHIKELYYERSSKIIETLMKVYKEVTNDRKSKPITIGGGTYAKSMDNCVAFGCEFPNTNNNIHNANESVDIEELILQVELYVKAIIELQKELDC